MMNEDHVRFQSDIVTVNRHAVFERIQTQSDAFVSKGVHNVPDKTGELAIVFTYPKRLHAR